jgi:hypothetical protein
MKKIQILILLITTLSSCNKDGGVNSVSNNNSGNSSSDAGVGGSLARFTISGNHLYTVDDKTLRVFDISTPSIPVKAKELNPGFGVETIFASGSRLYLGTTTGMYIYDITSPTNPLQKSFYSHIHSCDPVVANDTYAFVTLSNNTTCWRGSNELQVINIQNASSPYQVKSYTMTSPRGLGIDGDKLFVCDQGLKVYNASNVSNLILLKQFTIDAVDVIPLSGLLLVIGSSGMYEYSYTNDTISLLSTLHTF